MSLIDGQRLSLLEEALCKVSSSNPAIISSIIDEYSQKPHLKEQSAYHRLVFKSFRFLSLFLKKNLHQTQFKNLISPK